MFTVLMILSEIKYYIKNGGDDNFGHQEEGEDQKVKGNSASLSISCILLTLPISFLVLVFISWKGSTKILKIDET